MGSALGGCRAFARVTARIPRPSASALALIRCEKGLLCANNQFRQGQQAAPAPDPVEADRNRQPILVPARNADDYRHGRSLGNISWLRRATDSPSSRSALIRCFRSALSPTENRVLRYVH